MTTAPRTFACCGLEPFDVIAATDTAGLGRDRSYTDGLCGAGLPELLLQPRPTHGDDPGADWRLSDDDAADLLFELGTALQSGRLTLGDHREHRTDGGLTTMVIELVRPVPADSVHAGLLDRGTPVVPLRWSLHRPPIEPALPLDDAAALHLDRRVAEVAAATRELAGTVALWGPVPRIPRRMRPVPSTAPPDDPTAAPCGPAHALVAARAEQLLHADDTHLAGLITRTALAVTAGVTAQGTAAMLAALARPVGRVQALRRVDSLAADVVNVLTGDRKPTGRWQRATDGFGTGLPRPARTELRQVLRVRLHEAVTALLRAEALADVLPLDEHPAVYGPWAWTLSQDRCPGTLWWAPAGVAAALERRLRAIPTADLLDAAALCRQLRERPGGLAPSAPVAGVAITGAASLPAERLPEVVQAAQRDLRAGDLARLEDLVQLVSVAWSDPDRISDQAWRQLRAPFVPKLPFLGLPRAGHEAGRPRP